MTLKDILRFFLGKKPATEITSAGPEGAIPYRIGHEVFTPEEAVHPAASLYQKLLSPAYNRIFRYSEYEYMRLTAPVIHLALDLYATEATLGGTDPENAFSIQVPGDPYMEKLISQLIQNWFRVTYEMTGLTLKDLVYRLVQYGDLFLTPLYLKDDPNKRILGFKVLPEEQMFRIYCIDTRREIFLQDIQIFKPAPATTFASIQQPLVGGETMEAWSHIERTESNLRALARQKGQRIHIFDDPVFHFRLKPGLFYPYGESILEAARLAWRQLRLVEDSLVVYRIVRGPERLLFKVHLGRMPKREAEAYLMELRRALRKQPLVSALGQKDITQAPLILGFLDDLFIPVWEDKDIEVTNLTHATAIGEINDVLMFVDNLAMALRLPKEILLGTNVPETTKALVSRDMRFAIAVKSVQDAFVRELRRAIETHFKILGRPLPSNWKIKMISPGTYEEAARISILKDRIDLLASFADLKDRMGLPLKLDELARIYLQLPPEVWGLGEAAKPKEEEKVTDSVNVSKEVKLIEKEMVSLFKRMEDKNNIVWNGNDLGEYQKEALRRLESGELGDIDLSKMSDAIALAKKMLRKT